MRPTPRHIATLMAAAAALALAACDGNGPDSDPETTTVAPGEVGDSGLPDAAAGSVALSPQEFATTMAASDRFEIESARIIMGKSPSAAVREFAGMMVRDHSASTERLKAAVGTTPDLSLPATPALSAAQQTQLDQLRSANGNEAAALYLGQQVMAHETALAMLSAFAAHGTHEGLKAFAGDTANAVRTHLDRIRTLGGTRDGSGGGMTAPRGPNGGANNPNGPGTSPGTGTDTTPTGPTGAPPPR